MSFAYDTINLFRKIELRSVNLERTMGQYALEFDVRFSSGNPPRGAAVIDDLHVSVSFGNSKNDIGVAHPAQAGGAAGVLVIKHRGHGDYDSDVRFRLYLMPSTLEAIEITRNGESVAFHLKILAAPFEPNLFLTAVRVKRKMNPHSEK
jgi:hypothetical protein